MTEAEKIAPISAADREKALELCAANHSSLPPGAKLAAEGRLCSLARTAIPAYEARVAELEAAATRLASEAAAGMRQALETAVRVADEAREEWDKAPEGMKAGKLLIALSGHLKGYRPDIDAIHKALVSLPDGASEGRGGANG